MIRMISGTPGGVTDGQMPNQDLPTNRSNTSFPDPNG